MTTRRRTAIAMTCAAILAMAAPPLVHAQSRPASAPKSLARYVPATDLVFYLEFDGLDAHAAAWKKTATSKLLNETKLGAMLEDLLTQVVDQATAADRQNPEAPDLKASEFVQLYKVMARDGFVMGLAGGLAGEPLAVMVFRNGAKNGAREFLIKTGPQKEKKTERKGSRSITTFGQGGGAWWTEGDDLVFVTRNDKADAVLAVIEGKVPNATTNPIRTELAKADAGFEPVLISFLDFAKIPPPPNAARYGIDGLKRLDYRVGFQDEALYSVFRVLAPAPRRGVLALFESPSFDKNSLPPIPAGLTSWSVFSFSPAMFYEKIKGLAAANGPMGAQSFDQFEQGVQQNLQIRFKEDFLGQLGPKWVFYVDGEAPPKGQPFGKVRAALTAEVRDSATFGRTVDKVMAVVTQVLQGQAAQNPQARLPQIQKVAGPTPGYRLVLPPGTVPPQFAAALDPTILIGKRQFVLGLTGAEARAAVAGAKTWTPGPDFAAAFAKLPGNLIALSVEDPRATLPPLVAAAPTMITALNGMVAAQPARPGAAKFQLKLDPSRVPTADEVSRRLFPNTMAVTLDREGLKVVSRESVPSITGVGGAGVATALLLPAVQAAREAARRAQCVNDLKQIGLALHNYHSVTNGFPAAAITGKDGKPLLSWRVAILPYIEAQSLYDQFHLDEPWDSPHNKALIPKMPKTYICPSFANVQPGTTTYKTFVGGGAMFDPTKPVGLQQVTDGTSLTIAVVEGKTPVIWTKPEDIPFDPQAKPSLLDAGSNHPGGFNVLMGDGSVRFIKNSIALQVFRALITRASGEVINFDAF